MKRYRCFRLLKVEHLIICPSKMERDNRKSLPILPLPHLRSLATKGLQRIDLTNLKSLTALHLSNRFDCTEIYGKRGIFSRLKSFHGRVGSYFDLAYSLLGQGNINQFVQDNHLHLRKMKIERLDSFELTVTASSSKKITGVTVALPTAHFSRIEDEVNTIIPQLLPSGFQQLHIEGHPNLLQLPNYPNLQQIYLYQCSKLENINSLATIPYITIDNCPNIEDFSCLGPCQRYLFIRLCPNVKESDLLNFGNISYLTISNCDSIVQIPEDALTNNRFMMFSCLNSLNAIHLAGSSYLTVGIHSCPQLDTVNITGKVHLLSIYYCRYLDQQSIPQNYDYLDNFPFCINDFSNC
jgi:hypothetical protein